MGNSVAQHIVELPETLRSSVTLWFDRLQEQGDGDDLTDDLVGRVARIVACSEFAGTVLLREWSRFVANNAAGAVRSMR